MKLFFKFVSCTFWIIYFGCVSKWPPRWSACSVVCRLLTVMSRNGTFHASPTWHTRSNFIFPRSLKTHTCTNFISDVRLRFIFACTQTNSLIMIDRLILFLLIAHATSCTRDASCCNLFLLSYFLLVTALLSNYFETARMSFLACITRMFCSGALLNIKPGECANSCPMLLSTQNRV